ncbi:MAG: hypothetical protein V4509_00415 [Patescibacteria group bacterium]
MTHEQKDEFNSWEMIRVWIPLAIAIIGAAITWGIFTQKLSANDDRISTLETKQEQLDKTISDLRVDIATIKEGISFIKGRVQ